MSDRPDLPEPQPVTGPELRLKWDLHASIDDLHLAVLGIVLATALTVAFGISADWWIRLLSGVVTFACLALAIRTPTSRDLLVRFANWILNPGGR